jgi:hypothetical protein
MSGRERSSIKLAPAGSLVSTLTAFISLLVAYLNLTIYKRNPRLMFSVSRHVSGLLLSMVLAASTMQPAFGIIKLTDVSIENAIRYGLKNQDMGLSFFLGPNWIENETGVLLNVYTPYMEVARSAVTHKAGPSVPTDEDVIKARKTIIEDTHYIYHHPTVKFMTSMFGTTPDFAKGYYADVEGVGRGRRTRLLPAKMLTQGVAKKDDGSTFMRYSAINSYHFKYEDIAKLDELTFRLYGKGKKTHTFKIKTKDLL